MSNDTHWFANHALGWACGATREEAIEKLLLAGHITDPTWVRNCLKDGQFVTVYSCKVHAPIEENYRIEWYVPKGVETSEGQNDLVTYLTKTKYAIVRDPNDDLFTIRQRIANTDGDDLQDCQDTLHAIADDLTAKFKKTEDAA